MASDASVSFFKTIENGIVCMQKNENETKCVPDDEMPREIYSRVVVAPFFHSICLFVSIQHLFIHSFNDFPRKEDANEKNKFHRKMEIIM